MNEDPDSCWILSLGEDVFPRVISEKQGTWREGSGGDNISNLKSRGMIYRPRRLGLIQQKPIVLLRQVKVNHSQGAPLPGKGEI